LRHRRRSDHTQLVDLRSQSFASDIDFRGAVVDRLDDPLEAERADDDPVPGRCGPSRRRQWNRGGGFGGTVAQSLSDRIDRGPRLGTGAAGLPGRDQTSRAVLGL
jgi:hypothetical protein